MAGNARVAATVPPGRSDSTRVDDNYFAQCITDGCGWSYAPPEDVTNKRGPGGTTKYNARIHAATHQHHVLVHHTTEYDGRNDPPEARKP